MPRTSGNARQFWFLWGFCPALFLGQSCAAEIVWDQSPFSLSLPELPRWLSQHPLLWSYFIVASCGLVSTAVADPLSGQLSGKDIRLGYQKFGLCLTSHALGNVLAGKEPWWPPFLLFSSVLVRKFLTLPGVWLFILTPGLCLGCTLHQEYSPILLCSSKSLHHAWGAFPTNSRLLLIPHPHHALRLSVWTTLWELYCFLIICLNLSLQLR